MTKLIVTPEHIVQAYKDSGLTVSYGSWLTWKNTDICVSVHPCVIQILHHYGGLFVRSHCYSGAWHELISAHSNLTQNQIIGIGHGLTRPFPFFSDADYVHGHKLGREIRIALDNEIKKGTIRIG